LELLEQHNCINYLKNEGKRLVATQTGIDLIDTIENELLKSAELTGQWEKKLRMIELGQYDVTLFMDEMKQMVTEVVDQVKRSHGKAIAMAPEEPAVPEKKEKAAEEKARKAEEKASQNARENAAGNEEAQVA
jgi:DNA topoisomerase-3